MSCRASGLPLAICSGLQCPLSPVWRAPSYGAIRPTATSSDGDGSNAGLWRATPSANGRPKWLQPADAPSNQCALVAPATSPDGRVLGRPAQLILDGPFLDRRKGVFAVMDAARFAVVDAAPDMAEGPAHLQPFCTTLAHHGFTPCSATVDGNRHLLRILRQVWPTIVIQRCLVHIQRQGLSWCRQSPKCPDARHRRALFRHVMAIRTVAERDQFIAPVQAWEARYGQRLARQAERGRVFSDLKRARELCDSPPCQTCFTISTIP